MDSLTDIEQQMLDLEGQWWATPGRKEAAISDQFGMSAARYYQLLNRLLGTREALAYDPITVNRLQRIRCSRSHRGASAYVGRTLA
ncbi:DUF3263 domain-containing protein [Mycolicibacterium mageritense]|uniref:DUF3263 domain-containing protein n=1 Tax=Mycolicibacterium mageritense TaxID=53462 RepID=A0AAI8TYA3_MYCME|nr:DUF3263 domain-containing protein [Mycolicibacterium mageritense]BDY33213.1 hypothetical protein hbim_07188 [Mycolicibacterium mageritense]